jgi:hypothetical protein
VRSQAGSGAAVRWGPTLEMADLMVEWFQSSSDPWDDPPNSHGSHAAQESVSRASLDLLEECFGYVLRL